MILVVVVHPYHHNAWLSSMVTVLSRTTEDKNARAISKVVPTWQAVEGTAVQMCPSVLATKAAPLGLAWRGKHLESSQLPDSTPIHP